MRRRFEILWSKAEKHKVEHFLLMSAKEGGKKNHVREIFLGVFKHPYLNKKSFLGPYCYCKHAFVQNR